MKIGYVINRFDVIGRFAEGKDVLDIGCADARPDGPAKFATSGLHAFLKSKAASLTGIDLDQEGAAELTKMGFNVVCGNAEQVKLDKNFDCIVAGEVLEHLSNQGLFLDNMMFHLKPGGFFILTVPNAFSVVSIFRIIRRNKIKVHNEHTCWYDPLTISQLLKRHSFEVIEMYFTNKHKWHQSKNFYKYKYQIYKFFCRFRSYFSGQIIVVAKKSLDI